MQRTENGTVLPSEDLLTRLDERAESEGGVGLNVDVGLRVGAGGEEQAEERLGEGGDSCLETEADFGEGSNGTRAKAVGTGGALRTSRVGLPLGREENRRRKEKETHRELGHEGKEGAHKGSKLASEDGSESANEISSGSEKLSLGLRLLDGFLFILVLLSIIDLARCVVTQNLLETLAELLKVWSGWDRSARARRSSAIDSPAGMMSEGPTTRRASESELQSSSTTSLC